MIVCQLNQTEYRLIDSNKATLNQLTMMLYESIVSQLNQTELHRIDSIKMTLNQLTMMLCDDNVSIESNRISSPRFQQGDREPIDHDALR